MAKVEESATGTKAEEARIMKTYLWDKEDSSEALEFLCMAEGGEITKYEVLWAIYSNSNKRTFTLVKYILKEEQIHLSRCISMAKAAISAWIVNEFSCNLLIHTN